jgi:hypothetical protein
MLKTELPIKTLTMLVITTAIRPTKRKLPQESRLFFVKYPYMLMVPNRIAAPINALTILTVVKVMNIVLRLRPIRAANPCRNARAWPRVACFITKCMPRMATKGAKITTHLSAVPNNKAIRAGLDETNMLTNMLLTTAKNMLLYTLIILELISTILAKVFIESP